MRTKYIYDIMPCANGEKCLLIYTASSRFLTDISTALPQIRPFHLQNTQLNYNNVEIIPNPSKMVDNQKYYHTDRQFAAVHPVYILPKCHL